VLPRVIGTTIDSVEGPAGDDFAEQPPEIVTTHHGGTPLRGVAVMTMHDPRASIAEGAKEHH